MWGSHPSCSPLLSLMVTPTHSCLPHGGRRGKKNALGTKFRLKILLMLMALRKILSPVEPTVSKAISVEKKGAWFFLIRFCFFSFRRLL